MCILHHGTQIGAGYAVHNWPRFILLKFSVLLFFYRVFLAILCPVRSVAFNSLEFGGFGSKEEKENRNNRKKLEKEKKKKPR